MFVQNFADTSLVRECFLVLKQVLALETLLQGILTVKNSI